MPVEHAREGRLCVIRCVGSYPTSELKAALDALLAEPDLPEDAVLLLDMRQSASVRDRSVAALRDVADYFVPRAARFGNRCALLVDDLLRYGLMRMAAAWIEPQGVDAQVFRDEAEARRWLLGTAHGPSGRR